MSFAIVAYYWVISHLIFTYVRSADRGLLWLNLLFLFTVVALPYSAAVLGRYPLAAPALIVFGANVACCSLSLALTWSYALHSHLTSPVNQAQRRYIAIRFALSPAVAVVGAAVAPVAPAISLSLFVAVPVLYALTSAPRA